MAGKSKIEKYGLEARTAALAFDEHRNTREIADILTAELDGRDTISQSAVSSWLKPIREQNRDQAHDTINKHIKEKLDSDLESVEEIQLFLMNEMRDEESHTVMQRADLGVKALRVIDTKLRWGLGGEGSGDRIDPVDLDAFKNEVEGLRQDSRLRGNDGKRGNDEG